MICRTATRPVESLHVQCRGLALSGIEVQNFLKRQTRDGRKQLDKRKPLLFKPRLLGNGAPICRVEPGSGHECAPERSRISG